MALFCFGRYFVDNVWAPFRGKPCTVNHFRVVLIDHIYPVMKLLYSDGTEWEVGSSSMTIPSSTWCEGSANGLMRLKMV